MKFNLETLEAPLVGSSTPLTHSVEASVLTFTPAPAGKKWGRITFTPVAIGEVTQKGEKLLQEKGLIKANTAPAAEASTVEIAWGPAPKAYGEKVKVSITLIETKKTDGTVERAFMPVYA